MLLKPIFSIQIILLVAKQISGKDYCLFRCNNKYNIACNHTDKPNEQCEDFGLLEFQETDQKLIIEEHNRIRKLVASGQAKKNDGTYLPPAKDMNDLEWDDELAYLAHLDTLDCGLMKNYCHDIEYHVGQNSFYYYSKNSKTLKEMLRKAIDVWYSEINNVHESDIQSYPGSRSNDKITHFTQLVWGSSTKIGCAASKYSTYGIKAYVTVCNYAYGNENRKPVYEIDREKTKKPTSVKNKGKDYCLFRCGTEYNVACNHTEKPSGLCENFTVMEFQENDRKFMVAEHNRIRKLVASGAAKKDDGSFLPPAKDMEDLVWDEELAYLAHLDTLDCGIIKNHCHDIEYHVSPNSFYYYAMDSRTLKEILQKALNAWYSEMNNIKVSDIQSYPGDLKHDNIIHFVQLVWGSSSKIGCAASKYSIYGISTHAVRCNYAYGKEKGKSVYVIDEPEKATAKQKQRKIQKAKRSSIRNRNYAKKLKIAQKDQQPIEENKTKDYCSFRCGSKYNIACNHTGNPRGQCGDFGVLELKKSHQKFVLDEHNRIRKLVASGEAKKNDGSFLPPATNMKELEWDEELAYLAHLDSLDCGVSKNYCHDIEYHVGNNVYHYYTMGMLSLKEILHKAIDTWYSEINDIQLRDIKSFPGSIGYPGIDHFTQLIWGPSTKIGCAASTYSTHGLNSYKLRCNYALGNEEGKSVYLIDEQKIEKEKGIHRIDEPPIENADIKQKGKIVDKTEQQENEIDQPMIIGNNSKDYCLFRCDNEYNIACNHTGKPSAECDNYNAIEFQETDQEFIIQEHNRIRKLVASGTAQKEDGSFLPPATDMKDLEWDEELAYLAHLDSLDCGVVKDHCHDIEYHVGKNLFYYYANVERDMESRTLKEILQKAIDVWYSKMNNVNESDIQSYPGDSENQISLFTQLVWASSSKVGCAAGKYLTYGINAYTINCNYAYGNEMGESVYTIDEQKKEEQELARILALKKRGSKRSRKRTLKKSKPDNQEESETPIQDIDTVAEPGKGDESEMDEPSKKKRLLRSAAPEGEEGGGADDGAAPPTDGDAPPADGDAPPADGAAPPADGAAPAADGAAPAEGGAEGGADAKAAAGPEGEGEGEGEDKDESKCKKSEEDESDEDDMTLKKEELEDAYLANINSDKNKATMYDIFGYAAMVNVSRQASRSRYTIIWGSDGRFHDPYTKIYFRNMPIPIYR